MTLLVGFPPVAAAQIADASLTDVVNLFEIPDNPENFIPIADQGGLSTCWAHVASHLTEYATRAAGRAYAIHPLWTAIIGKKDRWLHWTPRSVNFNYMPWAFQDLVKHGVCDAGFFKQKLQEFKGGRAISDDQLFYEMAELKKRGTCDSILNGKSLSASPKLQELVESKLSLTEFLYEKVMKGCPKIPAVVPRIKTKLTLAQSDSSLSSAVRTSLSQAAPKPVSVAYFDAVWKYPDGAWVPPRLRKHPVRQWLPHYSVIVGQATRVVEIQGKPVALQHFLIRNTRGAHYAFPDRLHYVEILSGPLAGRRMTASLDQLEGVEYQVLGSWISESSLWKNSFSLNFLET